MRSPREAERRLCRPEDELTGRQSSVRYSGAAPTIQCRTMRAILNRMRFPDRQPIKFIADGGRNAVELTNTQDQPRSRVPGRIEVGREDIHLTRIGHRYNDRLGL